MRDNDISSWEVVLKEPSRGFRDLDVYDEDAYMPSASIDASRLGANTNDEDEHYVRMDCEGVEVLHD